MNDKKAKALRRAARASTVGKADRRLIWTQGHAVNDPNTTRGVYRAMKRASA